MEDSPKTSIQLNQTEILKLQHSLKQGALLPVSVINKLSENYYCIKIKNVLLNAYSEFDLRAKTLLVRVKELIPVPILQLIYLDNDQSNSFLDSWSEELEYLSTQEILLLKKISPLLDFKNNINLKELLAFYKTKSQYQIIPLNFFAGNEVQTPCITKLYKSRSINKCFPNNLIINANTEINNPLYSDLFHEITCLKTINHLFKNKEFRLEYALLNLKNSALLIPMETLRLNDRLTKCHLIHQSSHFGQINILALYSNLWKISIFFENSIYQKAFSKEFNHLLTNFPTNNYQIETCINEYSYIEMNSNFLDVSIRG